MPVFEKKDPQGGGYSSVSTVLACCAQGPSFNPQCYINQAWWHKPVMLTLRRLKQEDHRFKIILICIGSFRSVCAPQNQVNNLTLCFKKFKKEQTKVNTEKRKTKAYMTYSRKIKLESTKLLRCVRFVSGTVNTICLPNCRHLTLCGRALPAVVSCIPSN